MSINDSQLKIILLGANLISSEVFSTAQKEAEEKKIELIDYLIENGIISGAKIGQVIANYLNVNFVDLSKSSIKREILLVLPEVVAKSQEAIVFEQDDAGFHLATANPGNYEFIKLLERKTGEAVNVYYAPSIAIREALHFYQKDIRGVADKLIKDLKNNPQNEGNVVKLVNLFLEYAHNNNASDIHIEPLKDDVSVRFRIDGTLHEVATYPKKLHDKIVFRIKIMARLKTDEHAASQDGRFAYKKEKGSFDIRISILPVTDGENIVMRLLAEKSRRLLMEDLGFSTSDLEKVEKASKKPHGMILTVGPTGSGKTTTLYAIMQTVNNPKVNIMTIEDPVEYSIEHIQQTQVNPKKKLTFAAGLRSIVRQDPDIVMVGEIRDEETAGIAVNAAMTGHLLFSTLHANDAATTFPRLMDMEIEPFLVASSINIVISQRLVRKVCDQCRASYFLEAEELTTIKADPEIEQHVKGFFGKDDLTKIRFYRGVGCDVCNKTGYKGRVGIFEVMDVDENIRPLIINKSSAEDIKKVAVENGMKSMMADGIEKVSQGVTTIEEVVAATNM